VGETKWGWFRNQGIELVGDVLKPKQLGEPYSPWENRNLPNALAKVQDSRGAIRFVERYGLLGYDQLVPPTRFDEPSRSVGGDPLPWVLAHAAAVRMAIHLIAGLSREDEQLIRDTLTNHQTFVNVNGKRRAGFLLPQGTDIKFVEFFRPPDTSAGFRDLAAHLVRGLVNDNTTGIRFALSRRAAGVLAWAMTARALVDCIWWMVGEMAVAGSDEGGDAVRLCEECGMPFRVTHARQRFCPPDQFSKRSLCEARRHMRQFRQRQREKEGS